MRVSFWWLAGELFRDVLALLLPVACAGCGRSGRSLCPVCLKKIVPALVTSHTPNGLVVVSGANYAGVVQQTLLACKNGTTVLASPLAALLRSAALAALSTHPEALLCPVSPSRAALRRRGFDPVQVLLNRAGLPMKQVLRLAKAHPAQKNLSASERAQNLRGVHCAKFRLDGKEFLLVDDVVTTGATLDEAARAIRQAGGVVSGAITVAVTRRRLG